MHLKKKLASAHAILRFRNETSKSLLHFIKDDAENLYIVETSEHHMRRLAICDIRRHSHALAEHALKVDRKGNAICQCCKNLRYRLETLEDVRRSACQRPMRMESAS